MRHQVYVLMYHFQNSKQCSYPEQFQNINMLNKTIKNHKDIHYPEMRVKYFFGFFFLETTF